MLLQRLDAEQLQLQREDLLRQLAMGQETEKRVVPRSSTNSQEIAPEECSGPEGRYSVMVTVTATVTGMKSESPRRVDGVVQC